METTKSDNELVAEFCLESRERASSIHDGKEYLFDGWWYNTSELEFDTSWDWLHPVIDKVVEVSCSHSPNVPNGAAMALKLFAELPITSERDRIYRGVVEWIKWYNQQTVTPKE